MVLTAFFILVSAVPTAVSIDAAVTFVGGQLADLVDRRRLARLLREVDMDLAVGGGAGVDAWVAEELGPDALDPYEEVTVGDRVLKVTARQKQLLEVVLLEDGDDRRLRPLLSKIVLQSQAGAS